MLRLIARICLSLLANAVGLVLAAWILQNMTLSFSAFIVDVVIFTVIQVIVQPMIMKSAMTRNDALVGASALVSAFVALVLTNLISSGMSIHGLSTWVLATVFVWAGALIASLLLPLFLFKRWLGAKKAAAAG